MKSLLLFFILAAFLSCSESTLPSHNNDNNDEPQPGEPYNGLFEISAQIDSFDCSSPPNLGEVPQRVTITIDGDSITIDDGGGIVAKGTWDEENKHAVARADEFCVPVNPECAGCTVVNFDITFSDSLSFSGIYRLDLSYKGNCGTAKGCSSFFSITGTKQ